MTLPDWAKDVVAVLLATLYMAAFIGHLYCYSRDLRRAQDRASPNPPTHRRSPHSPRPVTAAQGSPRLPDRSGATRHREA